MIERFKEHVAIAERTGVGGAVLFAVCRGRLSEGATVARRGRMYLGDTMANLGDPLRRSTFLTRRAVRS